MAKLRRYRPHKLLTPEGETPPQVEEQHPTADEATVDVDSPEVKEAMESALETAGEPTRVESVQDIAAACEAAARAIRASSFTSKFGGRCKTCEGRIEQGDSIYWKRHVGSWHVACLPPGSQSAPAPTAESASVEPAPAEGSIDAAIDARIAKRLGDFRPDMAIDEATLIRHVNAKLAERPALTPDDARRIALEALQAVSDDMLTAARKAGEEAGIKAAQACAPTVVRVERKGQKAVEIENAHYLMPRLVKLLGAGMHVYLWGPAGTGKTTAALQAAKALGHEGEIDTLDPTTPKSSILGYRTPNGDPVHTAFTRCYGNGCVYVADECDNAPAHVQTLFNSALANGHAPAAWGLIARSKRFGFVGTGNTPGRPTPAFPDRRPMSAAFADRLYFMFWPLDDAIECRAAGLPVPPRPAREEKTCEPAAWVTWVRDVRAWAKDFAPTLQVTPRASLLGLEALALGETPEEIAHGLVFRGADATLVNKILAACPLP